MDLTKPDTLTLYVSGVLGSLGVELAACLAATVKGGGKWPPIYKRPFYLVVRTVFALTAAGLLPVYLAASSGLSALYLGASAPLVWDRLARGLQPTQEANEQLPDQSG